MTEWRLLYTRKEAARLLSLSERYVDILIRRGEIATVNFGRAVRIHRSEIERISGVPLSEIVA